MKWKIIIITALVNWLCSAIIGLALIDNKAGIAWFMISFFVLLIIVAFAE